MTVATPEELTTLAEWVESATPGMIHGPVLTTFSVPLSRAQKRALAFADAGGIWCALRSLKDTHGRRARRYILRQPRAFETSGPIVQWKTIRALIMAGKLEWCTDEKSPLGIHAKMPMSADRGTSTEG